MHAPEKRSRGREKEAAKLEMTPMIDVTFLLIIFFLCLRFKTLEGKLGAFLPKDVGIGRVDAPRLDKLDVLIRVVDPGVAVQAGARKQWSGRRLQWTFRGQAYADLDTLGQTLRRYREFLPNPKRPGHPLPVTIHADSGVFYGEVTRTLDLLLSDAVGFQEVTFAGGRP